VIHARFGSTSGGLRIQSVSKLLDLLQSVQALASRFKARATAGDGKPGPAATSQCDSPANVAATAPRHYGSFSIMAPRKLSIPGTYGASASALRSVPRSRAPSGRNNKAAVVAQLRINRLNLLDGPCPGGPKRRPICCRPGGSSPSSVYSPQPASDPRRLGSLQRRCRCPSHAPVAVQRDPLRSMLG
jgi:hypothetical protein